MSDSPFDPKYWTRQTEALRRVARAIVGDEALAEDVAQNAWVSALSRSRAAQGAGDEGWLRRVVRSRAIDALRRRRLDPASSHVDPDTRPAEQRAAAEIAESLELQRLLVEAVQSLDEPYRSTVALVHLEGWSVSDVTRLHAVSASTVHTRLRRAIQRLRERLAVHFDDGDRGRPSHALLLFAQGAMSLQAGPPVAEAASLTTASTLVMNKLLVVALASVALLVAWLALDPSKPAPVVTPSLAGDGAPAETAGPAPGLSASQPSEARTVAGALDGGPAEIEPSEARAALVVDVQWPDGTPAASVEVIAEENPRSVLSARRFLARADEAGRAVFAALPCVPLGVRTNRQTRKEGTAVEIQEGETVELRLSVPRGLDIAGTVEDLQGSPVAGAEVWMCTLSGGWTQDVLAARADAAGRFRVRQAPRGASFGARAAGFERSALVDLDELDRSAEPVEVRLRVGAGGAQLTGRVVDASGEPLAGVDVVAGQLISSYNTRADGSRAESWNRPRATTGADGRFAFSGLRPGERTVYARAQGYAVAAQAVTLEEGQIQQIELTLDVGATLTGVVLGLDGEPLAGATVRVFEERLREWNLESGHIQYAGAFGHAATTTNRAGRYLLHGAPTGSVFAYAMGLKPDWQSDETPFMPYVRAPMTLQPGEVRAWDVQLDEGLVIEGTATYADGAPLRTAYVHLRRFVEGRYRDFRSVLMRDGAFRFIQLEDGQYELRTEIWNLPEGATAPSREGLRPDSGPVHLVADFLPRVEMEPAQVRLRVDAPGVDHPGRIDFELLLEDGNYTWVDGEEQDGVFVATIRYPGRYRPQVKIGERVVWLSEELEIAGGEDLDLGVAEVGEGAGLRVHVAYPEGVGPIPAQLYVSPVGTWASESIELEGRAQYELDGLMPGDYVVRVEGDGFLRPTRELELVKGQTTEVRFALEAAVQVPFTVHREQPVPETSIEMQVFDLTDDRAVFRFKTPNAARLRNPYRTQAWLSPGRYALVVDLGDGRQRRSAFEVQTLDEADVNGVVVDFR